MIHFGAFLISIEPAAERADDAADLIIAQFTRENCQAERIERFGGRVQLRDGGGVRMSDEHRGGNDSGRPCQKLPASNHALECRLRGVSRQKRHEIIRFG